MFSVIALLLIASSSDYVSAFKPLTCGGKVCSRGYRCADVCTKSIPPICRRSCVKAIGPTFAKEGQQCLGFNVSTISPGAPCQKLFTCIAYPNFAPINGGGVCRRLVKANAECGGPGQFPAICSLGLECFSQANPFNRFNPKVVGRCREKAKEGESCLGYNRMTGFAGRSCDEGLQCVLPPSAPSFTGDGAVMSQRFFATKCGVCRTNSTVPPTFTIV